MVIGTKVCKPLGSGKEERLAFFAGRTHKDCEEPILKAFHVASDPTQAKANSDSMLYLIPIT